MFMYTPSPQPSAAAKRSGISLRYGCMLLIVDCRVGLAPKESPRTLFFSPFKLFPGPILDIESSRGANGYKWGTHLPKCWEGLVPYLKVCVCGRSDDVVICTSSRLFALFGKPFPVSREFGEHEDMNVEYVG